MKILRNYLDDVLIIVGCSLLIYATSLINFIATWYVAGAILIILGVLVGMGEKK